VASLEERRALPRLYPRAAARRPRPAIDVQPIQAAASFEAFAFRQTWTAWLKRTKIPGLVEGEGDDRRLLCVADVFVWNPDTIGLGVPNLSLPVPMHGFHGLFLTVLPDQPKQLDATPRQLSWCRRLQRLEYACEVVWGWQEAQRAVERYLAGDWWGGR
jgi:hypothetical protein